MNEDREILILFVQLTTSRTGNLTQLIHTLALCVTIRNALLQPRARGAAQEGRTRGGTSHGETNRCSDNQGWNTVYNSIFERDREDQGKDSPKQACSCWFARHFQEATSGANLYPPGVLFADVIFRVSCTIAVFICIESTSYVSLSGGDFYLSTTDWILRSTCVRIQSIPSIKLTRYPLRNISVRAFESRAQAFSTSLDCR